MRKQSALGAIVGALKGLAYVVFLPLVGIAALIAIGIRKLSIMTRAAARSSAPQQDSEHRVPGVSSRR